MSQYGSNNISVERVDYDDAFNRVFSIRKAVFVDELEVDHEDDYDGFDHLAHHYLVRMDDQAVATGRWRRTQTGGRYRIERIAVLKDYRRMHVGTFLLKSILHDIPKDKEIFVHVPVKFVAFFKSLGFIETGFLFEEAGLNHQKLIYKEQVEVGVS
ncbi:MAG: GNAT family N-acetyltransferase [Bacteroidota bacterium]